MDAKDLFDYKRNNYTTTKNTTNKFDSNVQNLQRELNEKGYTDKFGNPLKEDGIMAGKTAYAYDTYVEDKPKYKVEYPLYNPDKHEPKMLDDTEVKLASSNYSAQLTSYGESYEEDDRIGKGIWSLKNDSFGTSILMHWLYGNGKEYVGDGEYWKGYMTSNEKLTSEVKKIVLPLADGLNKNQSKKISLTTKMEMENGEDIIGYQYLHGTNADVGGFKIEGTISKNNKGDIIYDLSYTWNDKIDPNFIYESDSKKAEFAKNIPFASPNDYIIRIKWKDKTVIRANPSWYNWSYGWLK